MHGSLRRTRRTGMKGENRAASAMLVADVESAEVLLKTWTVTVFLGSSENLERKEGVEGLCFMIWR
jgi:hypothetical protein